ncbi:DUF2799 domain-containing protein [Alphaproteobacteria bacterium GH1-50]|uniref:DUF2799 domain-containing protein n=1 Tax=Kangsaoukella pontilimi TaxID=2691042 RepID=A0A7C9IG63_9RHOB|nr:DUF2799 domain-containing protein [Kangsaoukella pontilimi]MXQ07869.1 DUF2799 domain-containing protein [Kangsaoukella pontilimi]
MRIVLALFALALLAGCATLDEGECRSADWYSIGVSDGIDGRGPDHILAHARACNEYGIAPLRGPWEEGRQEGLKAYCIPERAWREGSRGKVLSNVCPPEDLILLTRANRDGLAWYRIGQEISQTEARIREINRQLSDLAPDAPERATLTAERLALRLELVTLRAERPLRRY